MYGRKLITHICLLTNLLSGTLPSNNGNVKGELVSLPVNGFVDCFNVRHVSSLPTKDIEACADQSSVFVGVSLFSVLPFVGSVVELDHTNDCEILQADYEVSTLAADLVEPGLPDWSPFDRDELRDLHLRQDDAVGQGFNESVIEDLFCLGQRALSEELRRFQFFVLLFSFESCDRNCHDHG